MRKRVKVSSYNSLEPQAEEERNHSQPRADEEENITSKSRTEEKRSYKIIKNSKPRTDRGAEYQFVKKNTLNLVRKRGRTSIYQESRISCGGGRERYLRSRMKK